MCKSTFLVLGEPEEGSTVGMDRLPVIQVINQRAEFQTHARFELIRDKFYDKINPKCLKEFISSFKYTYIIGIDVHNISFIKYMYVINLPGTEEFK